MFYPKLKTSSDFPYFRSDNLAIIVFKSAWMFFVAIVMI